MQAEAKLSHPHRALGSYRPHRRVAAVALMLLVGFAAAPALEAAAAPAPSSLVVRLSSPVQQYGTPISAVAVATVNGQPAAGRVRYFFDGKLAAESLTSGQGQTSWTLQRSIAVGAHRLQVYFLPSGAGISTSATEMTVAVVRATPVISVAVPQSSPPFGSNTTMSMAVSARNLGAATGTVTVSESGRYVGSATLTGGAAQVHFRLVSTPGNNVFTVSYGGSSAIAPGSRAVRFSTSRMVPAVAITALSASTSGGRVSVSIGGGPRAASGQVTALVDNYTVSVGSLNSLGAASLALPRLSPGIHSVKVRYAGDLRYTNGVIARAVTVQAPRPPSAPSNPCSVSARACVDLTHNTTWIQEGGRIIYGPVPMLSGRAGYRTDPGTFSVYWKDIDHHSSIFDNAPMPYAIFFDGGTAFHAGSLSIQSHGCIHLSYSAASYYWNALDYGDTVQVFGHSPY